MADDWSSNPLNLSAREAATAGLAANSDAEQDASIHNYPMLYPCHECEFIATSVDDYELHSAEYHYEYRCDLCGHLSHHKGQLDKHLSECHVSQLKQAPSDEEDVGREEGAIGGKKKERMHRCRQCGYETPHQGEFYDHKDSHAGGSAKYYCEAEGCSFKTSAKHHLEYHASSRHLKSKPFKCVLCEYTCINRAMLASHQKSHSTIHPYRCLDCSNSFKHRNQLKTHQSAKNHHRGSVLNPDGSLPAREITEATLAQLRRQREKQKQQHQQQQQQQQQQQRDYGSVSDELLDRVQEFLRSRNGIDGSEPKGGRRKRTFVRRRRYGSEKFSSAVGSESNSTFLQHAMSSKDSVLSPIGLLHPMDNWCSLAKPANMDPVDGDSMRFGGSSIRESPVRFPIDERVQPSPFQMFSPQQSLVNGLAPLPNIDLNSYAGYDSAVAMRAAHERLLALQQQLFRSSAIQQCLALQRAASLQSQMLSLGGSSLNSLPSAVPEMPAFAANGAPLMYGAPVFWPASSENPVKTKKRRSTKSRSERDRSVISLISESQGSAAESTEPLDLKIKHEQPSKEQTEFQAEAELLYANQYEDENTVGTFDTTDYNAAEGKEVTELGKDVSAAISTSAMRVDGYESERANALNLSAPTDLSLPNCFQETRRSYGKSRRNINRICERLKDRRSENSNRFIISKSGSSVLDLSVKREPTLFRCPDSSVLADYLLDDASTHEANEYTVPDQSDSTVVAAASEDEYFECCHCRIAFKDERMYSYHVGYHSENNAFLCARCGAERRTAVEFCRHIMTASHP